MEPTNNLVDKKIKYKKNTDMRFYENEYPEEGDIIMCKVTKMTDIGIYLVMMEYENKVAFMPYTELTKRSRLRKNIKSLINRGNILPTIVINIQDNSGNTDDSIDTNISNNTGEYKSVDVSKKEVNYEDGEEFKVKFNHAKIIRTIFQRFAKSNDIDVYDLYNKTIWKIERELENTCYNLLKHAINNEDDDYSIFDLFELNDTIKDKLIKILENKLIDPPKKIFSIVKVTCFTYEGIEAIKTALRAGLSHSTPQMKISIQLNSSPFYNIVIISKKVSKAIELMNKCIADIERVIKEKKGDFEIDTGPEVLDNN